MKNKSLGIKISERREYLNITREKLAIKIGCDISYISLIENNKRIPSIEIFKRLEKFLQFRIGSISFCSKCGNKIK